jgi:hypothetical protein
VLLDKSGIRDIAGTGAGPGLVIKVECVKIDGEVKTGTGTESVVRETVVRMIVVYST